jgi:ABC-type Fe3+-hydroxamate transport system substrate-binding protein
MYTNGTENQLYPSSIYVLTGIERGVLASHACQDSHEQNDYAMFVTTDGSGVLQIDQTSYRLGGESCWITEPGQHVRICTAERDLEYYRLTFRMVPLQPQGEEELWFRTGEMVCTPFSKLVEGIEEIYAVREETDRLVRYSSHVRFETVLSDLFQQNATGGPMQDPLRAVERSIEYVKQHYQEALTVEQLAYEAAVPRWRYTQLFKELTGQIPLDYINGLRINRAKQLLLLTADRVHEIAQNVGFNSEYYFNRRFKQMVGLAPGKYRNVHRDDLRVVSLFMEDYLCSLGITPIVQWAHSYWGKQDYLGLQDVPTFDVLKDEVHALSNSNPDVIMLRSCTGWESAHYEQCAKIARTCMVRELGSDWRSTMRILGDWLNRRDAADKAIEHYEKKAAAARSKLSSSMKGQTVAFLRVSADMISVEKSYSAPVMFDDLGMQPHPLVRSLSVQEARAGVSWEWLSALDADHIFYAFDKWHGEGTDAEKLQVHHPVWQSLRAVRDKRAYEVDFMTWMNHGIIANQKKIEHILHVLA